MEYIYDKITANSLNEKDKQQLKIVLQRYNNRLQKYKDIIDKNDQPERSWSQGKGNYRSSHVKQKRSCVYGMPDNPEDPGVDHLRFIPWGSKNSLYSIPGHVPSAKQNNCRQRDPDILRYHPVQKGREMEYEWISDPYCKENENQERFRESTFFYFSASFYYFLVFLSKKLDLGVGEKNVRKILARISHR